jgi:hypothetical protein
MMLIVPNQISKVNQKKSPNLNFIFLKIQSEVQIDPIKSNDHWEKKRKQFLLDQKKSNLDKENEQTPLSNVVRPEINFFASEETDQPFDLPHIKGKNTKQSVENSFQNLRRKYQKPDPNPFSRKDNDIPQKPGQKRRPSFQKEIFFMMMFPNEIKFQSTKEKDKFHKCHSNCEENCKQAFFSESTGG